MTSEASTRRTGRTEDRRLAHRLLAGDEIAFEEFADTYIPALYRFAAARLGQDRELTREIVQETICKALVRLRSFRGEAALMTWLCSCCRREIAMHYRRKARRPRMLELRDESLLSAAPEGSPPTGPEDAVLRKEADALVHVALDLLPPSYAKVLEWKYLENLSVREIATRLETGTKAAESLLTRARHAFRKSYARLRAGAPAVSGHESSTRPEVTT